jgi:predicted XRE-type DNA-binding protein
MTTRRVQVHQSQANIFADLGRPDAEVDMIRAEIAAELYRLAKERKLTQSQAGEVMGLTQPEVSRLFRSFPSL